MSNDQKPPAKTIMGWVPNAGQAPGQPGQPGQPQWPPQPAAPQPAPPAWGAPPQAPQPPAWGEQPAQAPQAPAQPAWGQPPQAPAQPAWGQQPAQPAWGQQPPQAPAQPAWGAPQNQQPGFGGQGPGGNPGFPGAGGNPGFGGQGGNPGFGGQGGNPGFGGQGGNPGFGGQGGNPGFGGQGGNPGFGGQGGNPGFPGGFGSQGGNPDFGNQGNPGFGGNPAPDAGYGGGYGAPGASDSRGGYQPSAGPGGVGRGIRGADATVGVSARLRFIRLTYLHLLGAILLFAGIEYLLFTNGKLYEKVVIPLTEFALGGRFNWAIVLGVFMAVSWITHYLADHTHSKPLHYVGLVVYTLAEALIFVPLLVIVQYYTADMIAKGGGNPNILRDAGIITLGVFGALTASVFVTKKDFSFLRSALAIGGAASLGLIALSLIFGFNLGIVFAIGMVLLCAGQMLYETSQVMAHHDPENYVGASLSLFASIALMFWYVIQILMKLRQ